MTTAPIPITMSRVPVGRAVLVTWLVTAAWDFLCASALAVFAYHSTFARFWQGVASVPFGAKMLDMGTAGVFAGLAAHLAVSLTWSALFVMATVMSPALRRAVARPAGAVGIACAYGPIIWFVMSLIVIPAATGRPPVIGFRWWVQVIAHIPFVTLPLVFTARREIMRSPLRRAGRDH